MKQAAHYEKEAVGKRIRQLRKAQGMSRKEMADITGKTVKHYSDIERGTVGMSLETLLVISESFHVSLDYILLGLPEEDGFGRVYGEDERKVLALLRHLPAGKRPYVLQSMEIVAEALAGRR